MRLTGGRISVPGIVAGIPVITVTTTGARSGQRRESPLVGVPMGDDIAVIGTHFGQKTTPSWWYNLQANPIAEVAYRGKVVDVRAREVGPEEGAVIWAKARSVYAGYEAYARRITNRPIHIAVLEATVDTFSQPPDPTTAPSLDEGSDG